MKDVLVLGGGFAGVESAIQLRKAGFRVKLVSDRPFVWVSPISIWIPTGGIKFEDATVSLEKLGARHGFEVVVDPVVRVEVESKTVHLKSQELTYDYLVLALGSNKIPIPGIEHTLSICGAPEESTRIKAAIEELVAAGGGHIAMGFSGNPKDKSAMRGGPVFELLFNVEHHLRKLGKREAFQITFFAPMPKPGQRMGPKALEVMDEMFKRRGITKMVDRPIERFEPGQVIFKQGEPLQADLIIFTPGLKGPAVLENSDLPLTEVGFVRADESCRVAGSDDVYAVGDVAALTGPEWKAKQGHLAEVMARNVAHDITAREKQQSSGAKKSYVPELCILCVMDTGDGAAYVYRDDEKSKIVPMPMVGHWLKKGWGLYWKSSRLQRFPRLPGL
jgi:sulfide:quinone oxidoreductase